MPLWKESLDLPFTPPMADFSPANLAQVCHTKKLFTWDFGVQFQVLAAINGVAVPVSPLCLSIPVTCDCHFSRPGEVAVAVGVSPVDIRDRAGLKCT